MTSQVIQLPDSAYKILLRNAARLRLRPDRMLLQWTEKKIGENVADAFLLQPAGLFPATAL
jgi:hypothetical protein